MAHRLASRLQHIEPFYVMEMAKAAQRLAQSPDCDPAQGGSPMIYLNIGEPDMGAAPAVVAAAKACLDSWAHALHPGHRFTSLAPSHQRLVCAALATGHRPRAHRRDRRRLGRFAAHLHGPVRAWR